MSVTLVKINNPFDIRDRDITSVKLDAARPFQDFLSEYVHISDELEYHASINGRVFAPDEIPAQLVAPGDYVAVCPVLRGGGGNGGKNPLAILAGIALAAFAFGVVAPGVSGMFGGSAIAGKLAGGITLMVGGQLISNAFGPKMKESEDTESYRWGSLQPITAQGAVIPITYGTVRTAGQVLNQYIRVDGDTQYMELLLCGGQGHIDEFSDIRINDNPAENFQNVTWDTRPGDNSQTPISGFENLYDTQYVGVTLKCGLNEKGEEQKDSPGEWFMAELDGDTADYLEVVLDFPEGMAYWPETRSGPDDHWVEPEFEYAIQTSQGAWGEWTPWFKEEFHGATAKPFTRTKRTNKLTSGKYRVRARMVRKDGTHPTNDKNTTVWTSLTSIVESPMVHPGKALLGIRMQATDQLNGGTPTVTWRQTRNNVLVYMNGMWQWKNARNPAWIIYDLCVQARFLDGTVHVFGEPPERMDLTAFAAWAAWNEQTLGNRGPIVMNLLVDETKDLWQWVNDVAASARGAVVMRGTKISCIWDQPSEPVQLFSMGNIVAGSFSGEFLSVDGRANAVEISFLNEAKNFEREQITVYGHGFDDADNRANPVSVELTGITNFDAAWQEGLYRLNQNRYILRTITFTADIDAIACQVGDVILVQHDVPRWGQGGRILSVEGNTVVVDHALELNEGVTYNVMIRRQSDDSILQRTAAATGSGATTMITISSAAGISPYDVFAIGEMQAVAKPFRVQEMSRSDDLHITLTCTEYIAALYTEDGVPPIIDYSLPSNRIAGLALTPGGYYSSTGQWVPELWANWSYRGQKPVSYEVEWKYDQGLWEQRRNTMETTAQCPLRETVALYSVRVRALYTSAPPSDWAYATSEGVVIGNGIPPDAPTNLRANGWFGFASLEWVNPTNADLSHIEVWENDKDELATASMVGQTRADSFTRMLPAGGTKWYWVRAVNYTGQKSDYNDQAGTPCIIDPESAEAWITDYLQRNPWIQEALEELNTRIEPLEINIRDINLELQDINIDLSDIDVKLANVDIKFRDVDTDIADINTDIANINTDIANINTDIADINTDIVNINTDIADIDVDIKEIKEVTLPGIQADLQGQITDNRNEINQNLSAAMDMIAEGVLRLADQADYVGDVFRWAGMEIDPEEGTVVIRALEDLKTETGYQFSNVEQRLDAQTADINLKASRAYVDESVASIIAAIIAAEEWKFNGTLGGWTAQNATLTAQPGGMQYVVTAETPSLTSPDFSIPGNVNNIIGLQFSQTAGTINAVIKVQYKTPDHGYSDSYMRRINVVGDISFTRSVQINMHELTAGGHDWKDSTITGIRLFIGSAVGQKYQINFVNIGQSSMSELALQDLELRMTQAEIDIDGANAAIALKADETTVTALQQRLNSAEVRIDGLNSAIALKADQTTVDGVNTRLQSAEVEIDALNGRISQQVLDYEGIQGQIDDLTAAAIQNSINEHEGQEERRIKLALARQELNARIDDTNEAVANYRLELLAIINENSALYKEQITAVANDLSAEVQSRETLAAKVGGNTAAIQTEQTTRSTADEALSTRITTLQSTVNSNTSAIQTEAKARADADNAEAQARQTLATKVSSNTAAIQTEETARINADNGLSSRITSLQTKVNSNTAEIQTEQQTRANADSVLASQITSIQAYEGMTAEELQAQLDALTAASFQNSINEHEGQEERRIKLALARQELNARIDDTNEAVVNYRLELLALINENIAYYDEQIKVVANSLSAEVKARETLSTKVGQNTAAIQTESTTRANADNALSTRIDTLQSKVNNNTAAIQTEAKARADADTAEAQARQTLAGKVNSNTAAIQTEQTTRANADRALSTQITTLQTKVNDNTAAIKTEETTRASADSALSTRITTLQGTVNDNTAAIQAEARTRADADRAEAKARETLLAKVDSNTAAIQTEQTTRSTADTALSNRITTLQSAVNSNTAAIQAEAQTRSDADTAEAKARQTLATKVNSNTAAIQTESTTRANADSALSTRIDTLQSTVNSNTAAIQTEAKARADADTAEANARKTLKATVDGNTAAIQTEERARIAGDNGLSTRITTLQTKVDDNTAAIQTEQNARIAGDNAEADERKTLQTKVDGNTSAIQAEEIARIAGDNGLSNRIISLQTKVDDNTAEIQTEQQTRANADSALASQITSIQAYEGLTAQELQAQIDALTAASFQNSVNEHEGQEERRIKLALAREELSAEIDETNRAVSEYRLQLLAVINENSALYDRKIQAVADDLSAEVTSRETLAATVGQNTTAIRNEQTTRANADNALSSQISTLTTKVNGNTAAIQNEAKTRADADTAEANARQTLQTKVNANTAAIQTETTARINADDGLTSQISKLQTKVAQNTAAVQAEAKARADADKVEADARNTLQGKVEQNTADIQDERILRIQGDEAEATARTQMQAKINEDIKAAVKKETEARVTSESAIVGDVNTIQTTLRDPRTGKGLIASVQQHAQAIANTNGTLETKYTLKLDSNGYVVGYQLYNGGNSKSTFTLSADSFVVAKPGSTNPRQMLVYDSATGQLALNSLMVNRAAIVDASINTLKLAGRSVTIPVGYNDFSGISWGTNNSGVVGVYKPLQVSDGSGGYANVNVGISNVVVNEPIYIIFSCDLQASICTLGFSFDVKIGSVSQGGREIPRAFTALKNERRSGSFSTSFIITPKNSGLAFIYPYWRISYTHAANDGSFNFNHSYIGYFSLLALQCKR